MQKVVIIITVVAALVVAIVVTSSGAGKAKSDMSHSADSNTTENTKLNRLANSDSPYLLKHATNPVDWYEWGPEALDKAKREEKLIFLSVGYTACHWCNELEKDCFEHQDFADVINERYISIKVDREQRPDIDAIYMEAAQALQGHGGWPNNVFLTPDLHPIYAVGYQKRDVFKQILVKIDEYWDQNRAEVIRKSAQISSALRSHMEKGGVYDELVELDMSRIKGAMDQTYGGFGGSTKFPNSPMLEFLLLERSDDEFLKLTMNQMARGGMYDHVGGGFHRYTVDPEWEIPHFEKMLYDNAVLIPLYARASVLFDKPEYGEVVKKSLEFIERELMNEQGGFLSSLDADSEGEEGKYYLWSLDDVDEIVGDPDFVKDYGLTKEGNMFDIEVTDSGPARVKTGTNTLRKFSNNIHEASLAKLFDARQSRIRPPLDDKVVAAWHSLMVSAYARAAIWLNEPKYLDTAIAAARFTLEKMGDFHYWRGGRGGGEGTLDDYAYAAMSFWDLFEATGSEDYLQLSKKYVDMAEKHFAAGDGGYFMIRDRGRLIARPRVLQDHPLPSAAATLGRVQWRLAAALDDTQRGEMARKTAAHILGALNGASIFSAEAMILSREVTQERVEVAFAFADGETDRATWLTAGLVRHFAVIRAPLGAESLAPFLTEGRLPAEKTTAYVCKDKVCLKPSTNPDELRTELAKFVDAAN